VICTAYAHPRTTAQSRALTIIPYACAAPVTKPGPSKERLTNAMLT
jgi:hypothetical protein